MDDLSIIASLVIAAVAALLIGRSIGWREGFRDGAEAELNFAQTINDVRCAREDRRPIVIDSGERSSGGGGGGFPAGVLRARFMTGKPVRPC